MSVEQADDGWDAVGRSLLAYQFQQIADELHTEFVKASEKTSTDERVTGHDVERLYNKLERAQAIVDEFAKVPEDYDRPKRIENMLPPEELQAIVEENRDDALRD